MIRKISNFIPHYLSAMFFQLLLSCRKFSSHKSFSVLFYSAAFCSLSVWVEASADNYSNAYLGAKLGYSYNYHSCVDMAVECDREDAGYGFFAGYDFKNHFSLELSGTKLGDTNVIYPDVILRGELSTIDLSVKYTRRLHKNIQAFGKLGVAYWDGKITGWENTTLNDSGERPVAGAGIQFPLFAHVDGRFEYQYFDQLGNNWMGYTDAHFISFSLIWNFSEKRKVAYTPQSISYPVSFATSSAVKPTAIIVSEDVIARHVEHVLADIIAEL